MPKNAYKPFSALSARLRRRRLSTEAIKPKAQMAKLDIDKTQSDGAVGEWLRQATN